MNNKYILMVGVMIAILTVIIIGTLYKQEDNTERKFISYNNKEFNNRLEILDFRYVQDIDKIIEQLEYEPIDIIYTSTGAIVIHDNEENIEINNILLNKTFDVGFKTNKKLDAIPINIEKIDNYTTTLGLAPSVSYYSTVGLMNQAEYADSIINILKGYHNNLDKYFEKDVITPEIEEWLTNNIKDETVLCIYAGKSDKSLKYIDRLVILNNSQDVYSEIKIRVILKLNKLQKVYDIDIY